MMEVSKNLTEGVTNQVGGEQVLSITKTEIDI